MNQGNKETTLYKHLCPWRGTPVLKKRVKALNFAVMTLTRGLPLPVHPGPITSLPSNAD